MAAPIYRARSSHREAAVIFVGGGWRNTCCARIHDEEVKGKKTSNSNQLSALIYFTKVGIHQTSDQHRKDIAA